MGQETLGSFSFDVAGRILEQLYNRGQLKRTNLAMVTGLNYSSCIRYLGMIRALGWIDITRAGEVSITTVGQEVRLRLLDTSEVLRAGYINNIGQDPNLGKMEKDNQAHFTSTGGLQSRSTPELNNAISLVDQGNSNTSTEINPHNTKTTRKYTVMIVDDEAEVALTYESFLTSTGCYSVKTFTEPYLALLDFANKRNYYDLAILDVRMPDINGLQLYQSLNAMNPSCKFIFVSSLDAVEELLSIFPGIRKSNIIRKPIEKKKFLGIVNLILG